MSQHLKLLRICAALTAVAWVHFAHADMPVAASIKLSEVKLPASTLKGEWETLAGFVVDDFGDLSTMAPSQLATAEALKKQLTPLGIVAAADYSLNQSGTSLNVVTVRVFRFSSAQLCEQFFKKKYEYPGWQEHYRSVPGAQNLVVLDSTQMNKRIFRYGSVWITAHQLGEGSEHVDATAHVLSQLFEPSPI